MPFAPPRQSEHRRKGQDREGKPGGMPAVAGLNQSDLLRPRQAWLSVDDPYSTGSGTAAAADPPEHSEVITQGQLRNSRIRGARNLSEGAVAERGIHASEVGVIEDVE